MVKRECGRERERDCGRERLWKRENVVEREILW